MSINKSGHQVCDFTSIILNDGITLYPGYISIEDNKLIRWDTTDPMNEIATYKPWILHNRVGHKYEAETEECTDEKLQGKHFVSRKAMEEYVKTQT